VPLELVPDEPLELVPDEVAALLVPPVELLVPDAVAPDDVAPPAGAPLVPWDVPVVSDCWFCPAAELVLDPLVVPFAMTSSPGRMF
jgi:hypothetical protein